MIPADWNKDGVRRGTQRMLALRSERRAAGERPTGWKLAFGAPASLERFGLERPLLGFLTDVRTFGPDSTVSCEGWQNPVAEPEVAVYIGSDVEPTFDDISGSIAGLGPAIELAAVHPPQDIEGMLAGNIYHRAVILGEPDRARAGGIRDDLRGRVTHDGVDIADAGDVESLNGDLLEAVSHAARLLAAAGEQLRAGDVLIAGSIVPPLSVRPGEEIVFELAPLPPISVRV